MEKNINPAILRSELRNFSVRAHDRGMFVYDLISAYSLTKCLDIGTRGGIITAYIAAAVSRISGGQVLSLGIEGLREQAVNAFAFLAKYDLDRHVRLAQHKKSLSQLLLKLLLCEPGEVFDLVHISSGPSPHSLALMTCLIERSLKPGGWVLFDRRKPSGQHGKVKPAHEADFRDADADIGTPTRIFRELIGMSPYFADFRRDGDLLLARKVASYSDTRSRERGHKALVIGEALARSQDDLLFRVTLKDRPEQVLGKLKEPDLLSIHFEEGGMRVPGSELLEESIYRLPETSWERRGRLESRKHEAL
jgi:predicted O-methyltransferase YrrM